MDEIVDVCVGSLHLMAKDPHNRAMLRQYNCIPLIVQVGFDVFLSLLAFLFLAGATLGRVIII